MFVPTLLNYYYQCVCVFFSWAWVSIYRGCTLANMERRVPGRCRGMEWRRRYRYGERVGIKLSKKFLWLSVHLTVKREFWSLLKLIFLFMLNVETGYNSYCIREYEKTSMDDMDFKWRYWSSQCHSSKTKLIYKVTEDIGSQELLCFIVDEIFFITSKGLKKLKSNYFHLSQNTVVRLRKSIVFCEKVPRMECTSITFFLAINSGYCLPKVCVFENFKSNQCKIQPSDDLSF